jgi:hypothetical protein
MQESATDTTNEHLKAMSNSLIVLQSEHTELLKCVRTTSTVLRDVMGILRTHQLTDARPVSMQKLWHVCRSLDALAGLASSHFIDGAEGMEYYDEVDMDQALEGFSANFQHNQNSLSMHELADAGTCCCPGVYTASLWQAVPFTQQLTSMTVVHSTFLRTSL